MFCTPGVRQLGVQWRNLTLSALDSLRFLLILIIPNSQLPNLSFICFHCTLAWEESPHISVKLIKKSKYPEEITFRITLLSKFQNCFLAKSVYHCKCLISHFWLMLHILCEQQNSSVTGCAWLPELWGKRFLPDLLINPQMSWNAPRFITNTTILIVIDMTYLFKARFWNLLKILPKWHKSCTSQSASSLYRFQVLYSYYLTGSSLNSLVIEQHVLECRLFGSCSKASLALVLLFMQWQSSQCVTKNEAIQREQYCSNALLVDI